MRRPPLRIAAFILLLCAPALFADDHVVVVATADENYTRRKFGDGQPTRETFVFMQGNYFRGASVDRSLERMTFRDLIAYLTPRLAEQQFVPAKTVQQADLLLLVHWGATNPRVGMIEMTGKTTWEPGAPENLERLRQQEAAASNADPASSPGTAPDAGFEQTPGGVLSGMDEVSFDKLERLGDVLINSNRERDVAQLLGYTSALRKFSRSSHTTAEESMLRFDLSHERYFVIIRAYDLRHSLQTKKPQLVWTVHMNISSPGNNFQTAMTRMSSVGPQFFGTTTDSVRTIRAAPKIRGVKVELGDLIILGEAK